LRYLFTILIIAVSSGLFAQQPDDDVDYKHNRAYLEKLIEEQINEYRVSKNLPPFIKDQVLTLTAEDQTIFMVKTGKISHSQASSKKETPFDRVMFYNGMHGKVGENIFKIVIDTYTKISGSSKKVKLKSYKNVATAIAQGWIKDKEGAKNLGSGKYVNSGLAVIFNEKEKTIIATQVVGSVPFPLPEGVKPNRDDYGVLPYDKGKCSELVTKYGYLPQLMSDNILFKNGEIYFYFHDLALFKNVLKEPKDAIALDIISKDQYACETGNKYYPSKIHTGVMLPPVSKSHIFGKNELEEKGEILVSLGPIPDFVDTNNVEFNLLIIKEGCLCQTIVYNSLGGENLHSLDMGLIMDTLSVTHQADSVLNVLEFTIPFERNKSKFNEIDINPFLDSISLNKYDLKSIEIIAYSSIEGGVKENEIIQQKRAKSILQVIQKYNLKNVKTSIITKENWDGFYTSIKGSPYEKEFIGKTQEEVRKIVNSDTLSYDLEPYLSSQRKAEINLTVEKIFMDESLYKILPAKFDKAVANKEFSKAKIYQSVMLNNIATGGVKIEAILAPKIPHLKGTIALNNNQIAARWYNEYNKVDNDSLNKYLLRDIETQLVISPNNVYLRYNKIALRLLLWSNKYSRETNPKDLSKEIRMLYNSKIEKWKISRLILNYNLVAADVYYEKNKFNERDKALGEVQKILLRSKLTRDQAFKVANYFIFQMRIDWTIDLMKPWAAKENIDEEFLFTFLSVAIYNKEKVPETEYLKFMEKAKQMNTKRFCELFGFPNMSFQLLKDLSVKELYCKTCR
jgi:uncharacterized protein YkwD